MSTTGAGADGSVRVLASGALVQPFGPVLEAHPYWVVHPRHPARAGDVGKLADWLVSAAV